MDFEKIMKIIEAIKLGGSVGLFIALTFLLREYIIALKEEFSLADLRFIILLCVLGIISLSLGDKE